MKILQLYLAASLLCSLAVAKVLTATEGWDYCKEYDKVKGVICSGREPIKVKYNIAKGRISTSGHCDTDSPDTIYIDIYDSDSLLIKSTTEYSCEDRYGSYLALPEEIVRDAKFMKLIVAYSSSLNEFAKCWEPGKHLFETYIDKKGKPVKNNYITCEKPESYYKKKNQSFSEHDECGQEWFFNSYNGGDKRLHLRDGVEKDPECPDLGDREFE